MKKTYDPSRSDIEYLNYIQSIENEIQRIRKQGTQVRIGFLISGVIATIMTLFYQKNELWSLLMVPVLFFGFFYYFQRKDDSTLRYKYKHILELEEKVMCYYKIDEHKVYIIQNDGKRIELSQY
jgi:hypothetical protein